MSVLLETLRGYDSKTLGNLLSIFKVTDAPGDRDNMQSLVLRKLAEKCKIEFFLGEEVIIKKALYVSAQKLSLADIDWETADEIEIIDMIFKHYQSRSDSLLQNMSIHERQLLVGRFEDNLRKDGKEIIGIGRSILQAAAAGTLAGFAPFTGTAGGLKALGTSLTSALTNTSYGTTSSVTTMLPFLFGYIYGQAKKIDRIDSFFSGIKKSDVVTVMLTLIIDYKDAENDQNVGEWFRYICQIEDKLDIYRSVIANAEDNLANNKTSPDNYLSTDWYQLFTNDETIQELAQIDSADQDEIRKLLKQMKNGQKAHQELLRYARGRSRENSQYQVQINDDDESRNSIREQGAVYEFDNDINSSKLEPTFNDEETNRLAPLNPDETKFLQQFAQYGIIGESRQMHELCSTIADYADENIGILITGDTGTGKQLVADSLHKRSKRSRAPFIELDCGAIEATLAKSELFGIVKGAATDVAERKGKIRAANQGTLFLDEIGNMSLGDQAAILKVMDSGKVTAVGADSETHNVVVRYIAATNADIKELIDNQQFREDLYNRIAGKEIRIPALEERPVDIPIIANHFFHLFWPGDPLQFKITKGTFKLLKRMAWPGNVRKLKMHIQNVVITADNFRTQMTPTMFRKILSNPNRSEIEKILKLGADPNNITNNDWEILVEYIESRYNDSETAKRTNKDRDTIKKKITSIFLKLGYPIKFDVKAIFNELFNLGYLEPWQKEDFFRVVQKRYGSVIDSFNKKTPKLIYYREDEDIAKALLAQTSSTQK